jgi:hypothetical protein
MDKSSIIIVAHNCQKYTLLNYNDMQGDRKELENMKCELSFPQTSTSWSHMNGFWSVCNIRQPLSAYKELCIQFPNSRSG